MKLKRYFVPLCLIVLSSNLFAQYCTEDNRFTEVEIFSLAEISSIENITYATDVLDWNAVPIDLEMDVFYPSDASETLSLRPFNYFCMVGDFKQEISH